MLQETMSKVKAAEEQASQIIKDSQAESKRIIDDAQGKAADMLQQSDAAGKVSGEKMQEYAQSKRQSAIADALAEAEKEVSALQEQTKTKEKETIDLVMSLLT